MLIKMRQMITGTIFLNVKFKYKTSIDDWESASKIDVQDNGIAFYFNGFHYTRVYVYDYSDNCKTMNRIMKNKFDKEKKV